MQWVRLETSFPGNPKVLELVSAKKWQAIASFVCSLSYCGAQDKGGFIHKSALGMVHGTPKTARELVEVGLWEDMPSGWQVHDWETYQPSSDRKLSPSERGKKAANARWHRGESSGGADVVHLHG